MDLLRKSFLKHSESLGQTLTVEHLPKKLDTIMRRTNSLGIILVHI